MGIGDLDSGARFGLPAIGLPQSKLDTPGSDTERRSFPGLATKSSVFAWTSTYPLLLSRTVAVTSASETINLRTNTATGGTSVDVPTWAAGAVIVMFMAPSGAGTSTYAQWNITCPVTGAAPNYILQYITPKPTVGPAGSGTSQQITVPFYDEPLFTSTFATDGTSTAIWQINLMGFVRNV